MADARTDEEGTKSSEPLHKKFSTKKILPEQVKQWYLDFERTPLDAEQMKKPHGILHIVADRCKSCSYCWEFCPEQVLTKSDNINKHGYHYPEVADGKEQACIACMFCTDICPDFAIFVVEEERKDDEENE